MNRASTGWQWDDIRFFLAVARAGSLSGAARVLGVGQVTAGRRVALLERRLGVKLLNRTPEAKDAALVAREEAIAMLKPFSELAEHDGGFEVEASVGMEGPKVALSKELHLPGWLRLWWNDHTPFGGMRKTFRRMWMAAESYDRFEQQIRNIWGRS
jgi:regulatory helix-turn-helix LysR family protein